MTEVFEFEEESTIEATFQIGVTAEDHGALYNRDAPDQHPISAITDLQTTLDGISGDVSAETTRAEGVEGNLENLTTTDKTNLVSAINEVDSHADTNATNLSNHIADKNNPHKVTKAQVGLGNCDNTSDLDKPISTATQNALNLKVNTTDLGNAELDIQKNGTSVGKFTANASTDKVINLVIPTQASDVNALPDSTKYGASLSLTINSSTFVVTAQLKDQDGGNLGSAQTIDLPLESVVVNGSYDSVNKKIILTLEDGNTIDIPVGDLVAGLQSEITVDNKLASDLVDDTNQTHKFATSAQLSQIATNTSDISNLQSGKADKATTLAGYGITNAYTKTEVDSALSNKADKATTLSGYGITNAYTKTEVDTALSAKQDTIDSSHKLSADLVDDTSTTNKFVTASDISTWNGKQDALTQSQLDAVNSGITSAKVTQYDGYATSKANVSLSNLDSMGQMTVNTLNGTASNFILSIAQELKCELSGTVFTLKAGSIRTILGATYTTITTESDITVPLDVSTDGRFVMIGSVNAQSQIAIEKFDSGATTPSSKTTDYFWNTTDKLMYLWRTANSEYQAFTTWCYPSCLIDVVGGVASFAKDSKGHDLIFNGAGFIGHSWYVLPNVWALRGNGYSNGLLASESFRIASVVVGNIGTTPFVSRYNRAVMLGGHVRAESHPYVERQSYSEVTNISSLWQFCRDDNILYRQSGGVMTGTPRIAFVEYQYDGTNVLDFIIYQPYEGAVSLFTNALEKQVATKQDDVTTLTGYDATQTQTLKNINGVLTWVTD